MNSGSKKLRELFSGLAGEAVGVGEAGGGGVLPRAWLEDGEAGLLGFSLSGSEVPSEEAKWWGDRSAVAAPVSRTWVC